MALKDVAEQYFSRLNPIAARIYDDINETKATYENLWTTLSEKEKQLILNESIIRPEVLLKYNIEIKDKPTEQFAVKMVVDDHCSYRDEHSAPFSFRTKSQMDLTLFPKEKEACVEQVKKTKTIIKTTKPKEAPCDEIVVSGSTLPRTGLDLLDNW